MVNVHQYAVKYTKILLLLFAFFGLTIALSDELDDDFPGRVITSFIIIFNWLFFMPLWTGEWREGTVCWKREGMTCSTGPSVRSEPRSLNVCVYIFTC